MPKHYCTVCLQPMRKMGPDVYVCPMHPDQAEPEPAHEIEHKGGGYYDIILDGEVVDTVRGEDAAKSWSQ